MRRRLPSRVCILACAAVACSAGDSNGNDRPQQPAEVARPAETGSLLEVLEEPDSLVRARRLAALLAELGPDGLDEVTRLLDVPLERPEPVEVLLILRYWARHDPAAASDWAFHQASPLYAGAAVRSALSSWAATDPAAAVAGMQGGVADSTIPNVARIAEVALVEGWFRSDREGVLRYIYSLGTGMPRQRALYAFVLQLFDAEGATGLAEWANGLPEDDARFRMAALRQTMSALATRDWDRAMEFCAVHCRDVQGLLHTVVRRRFEQGDVEADVIEWVAGLSVEDADQHENRRSALWLAFSLWTGADREAALDWMARKHEADTPEPWLPQLYGEYARQLSIDSYPEAIRWAERSEPEDRRETLLVRLARAWLVEDAEAAEEWLSGSGLSERAKQSARDPSRPTYLPRRR